MSKGVVDMINKSKLCDDILQKTNLSKEIAEKFAEENDKFLKNLTDKIDDISAYEAIDIISFLILADRYFVLKEQWDSLLYTCLMKIRNGIYNGEFSTISSFSGITYINFIIRELSQKIPELKRFLHTLELLQSEVLSRYLNLSEESEFYQQNGFELIQGMSGVLKYYLDSDNDNSNEIIDKIVSLFIQHLKPKIIMGYPTPVCHYYPSIYEKKYMTEEAPNGCVNYGVSHGMGGPLTTLSLAYKKSSSSDGGIKIIDSIIDEYMKSYYYVDNIIYWPGRITFEEYIGKEKCSYGKSRMSWCYGSIGILNSLYIAAKEKSDKELTEFCVNELKKIASMDIRDYLLASPIVCHGLSGLALIFKRMHQETQDKAFYYKMLEILEKLIHNFVYRDIQNVNLIGMNEIKEYDYLEGYTGILQTIYSVITDTVNVNERRLLIY